MNVTEMKINKLSAGLADITQQLDKGVGEKKAIITFVSDDGNAADYNILKPIFETAQAPCVSAVVSGRVNTAGNLTSAQLQEFQNMGWEIASHTVNHVDLTTLTEAQAEAELKNSKEQLEGFGCKVSSIAYPFGGENPLIRKLTKKYYKSATIVSRGVIIPPHRTFQLNRVALGSYFSPPDATYPVTNTFNDYYKAWVDEAINNKGWVIFVIHPAAAEFNAAQQGYLADTINYAKSQNVPIMTMSEALDEIGNAIDVGDNGTDTATPYFMVGVDGKVQGSGIGDIPCNFNYAYDANSPANSFPSGKITVTPIGYSSATGFPRNEAGLLITSTIGAEKGYWYQEYHVYNTNQIYKRGCRNSDGIWWTWKRIDSFSSEFQTVTESSNIYTLNLTTGENFAIETGNSVAKSIAFSNVPATTNSLLSVSVKLKYTNAAAITHPAGTVWQGGAVPTFSAGKQYLLLYVSYDNGNTWLGYATQGW